MKAYPKDNYSLSTICRAGDVYVADTRGYHRGCPVTKGRSIVIYIEFSISKFGAESQYIPRPMLDKRWESYQVWKRAINNSSAWTGLFLSNE